MSTMFDKASFQRIRDRASRLQPDSQRLWGTLTVSKMLAHCSKSLETAVGDMRPSRMFIGRIIGFLIKGLAIHNDRPMRRNTPTDPALLSPVEPDFAAQHAAFLALMERFHLGGPSGCTQHPHSFFGRLTPEEWGILMYKHIDHHLRQFGV